MRLGKSMKFGLALLGAGLLAWLTACDGGGSSGDGGIIGENGPARAGTRCITAESASLTGGSVTLSGSTANATDEYGGAVTCRSSQTKLVGPQYYYKINLEKDVVYRLGLNTQVSQARVILFDSCGAEAINLACGSGGDKGGIFGSFFGGRAFFFTVPTSGPWYLSVDSLSSQTSGGDFTLSVETANPAANRRCSAPEALTFDSAGKVSVKGDTEGALNEFLGAISCGTSSTFNGPQVYYTLPMKAGKVYALKLEPEGNTQLRFYVFSGSACLASEINSDCGSGGKTGLVASAGFGGPSAIFRPSTDGTYTIAVDATQETSYGKFELTVEEVIPPANATCDKAEAVTLQAGQTTTVKGTTFAAVNEFGEDIKCGGFSALDGPQAYYKPSFEAGKTYEIEVKPSFAGASFYAFSNGCDAQKIEADCASKGAQGIAETISSKGEKVYLTASGARPWIIAVDSTTTASGEFELAIREFPVPANGRCATAQALTLTSGQQTTVNGDTTAVANEFGTAINCGKDSSGVVEGSQLYYKVALTAGKTYELSVAPEFAGGRLIVFGATCDAAAINADCASNGQTGLVSSFLSMTKPTVLEFTPQTTGDYHILVDSTSTRSYGKFVLIVGEKSS